jgi:hypothetical protein
MNFFNFYLVLIFINLILSLVTGKYRLKIIIVIFFSSLLCVELTCYYFKVRNWNNLIIYNCWFPLEYGVYAAWVSSSLNSIVLRRKIILCIESYLAITIVIYFSDDNMYNFNTLAFQIGMVLILPVLFRKLYEMVNEPIMINPLKNPLFWLISGLLFSYLGSFFQFSLENYLRATNTQLLSAMKIINILLTDLLYLCIIMHFILTWLNRKLHM